MEIRPDRWNEAQFLPGSGCIDTAIWMHYMDANQTAGEETIQVRRARHAGHCWRSKDELVSDVLLWTPTYGQAKAGRPARTYIQQLCEDTGCNPEDLLEAMNDREKWREMVKDIRAGGTTWWWWWLTRMKACTQTSLCRKPWKSNSNIIALVHEYIM